MPYDIHVIKAGDFIRLGAHGQPDLVTSRQILAELAATMVRRGLDRAILDCRQVEGQLSTTDLFLLATTFQEAGFRHEHRLAVLHRPNRMDRADFFAMCATNRGWNVRAFDAFEDAFEWLTTALPVPSPPAGAVADERPAGGGSA